MKQNTMISLGTIVKGFATILTLTTLAACSGGGGGSGGGSSTDSTSNGSYSAGCQHPSSSDSYTYDLTMSGTSIYFLTTQYEESSSCTTAAVLTEANHTVSFPGAATTPSDASKINITRGTVKMTPKSSSAVTYMNSISSCGYSNWTLNVAKDVTTTSSCGWGSVTAVYSIYKLVSGVLYLGTSDSSHNGTSDAQRHVQYSSTTYTKQ